MADRSDDINQQVDEKTGFGSYVWKNVKLSAMILGGTALGAVAGYQAGKWGKLSTAIQTATKWIGEHFKGQTGEFINQYAEKIDPKVTVTALGALVGTTMGTIPNTYEHWKEGKKAQLRVEEMADDVVKLREQRNATLTSLREQAVSIGSQNKAIQEILAQGPKNHEEQISRDDQASEPQRG